MIQLDDTPLLQEYPPSPVPTKAPPIDTSQADFRQWFGDSVVVDSGGNPKTVYEGLYPYPLTGEDITGSQRSPTAALQHGFFAITRNCLPRTLHMNGALR
jgi:hypothetical protein